MVVLWDRLFLVDDKGERERETIIDTNDQALYIYVMYLMIGNTTL